VSVFSTVRVIAATDWKTGLSSIVMNISFY